MEPDFDEISSNKGQIKGIHQMGTKPILGVWEMLYLWAL